MNVLVHDFAGHAFPVQLSRELARRGHRVVHAHCPTYASGKGALDYLPGDPAGLEFLPLPLPRYDKHSIARRPQQEIRYGRLLAALIRSTRPDVVVSGNTPLLAQALARSRSAREGLAFVFWQQDILSLAIARLAGVRLSRAVARFGALPFALLEGHVARRSDAVIPISASYVPWLASQGVEAHRISVIENWAPVDDLPVLPRANAFATQHGLVDRNVVLYSGTLGLKHDSLMLESLVRSLASNDTAVVVVSEGPAVERLRAWAEEHGFRNLVTLPFQPYERLPEVHASADVLISVLDQRAGGLSVPSKVLTYLCAGRPLAAAIPASNRAAEIINDAEAGIVVDPADSSAFCTAVRGLLLDPPARETFGRSARAYAERVFAISEIAARFERVLMSCVPMTRAAARSGRRAPSSRPTGGDLEPS